MTINFYTNPFPCLKVNQRYLLQEQDIKDSADFLQYYSNPRVGQHILATKPRNLIEATREIQYCHDLFHQKRGIYWSLVDTETNKMIGAIGVYINSLHQRGEICYDLNEEYWNRGIMTLALQQVVDFCFSTIQLSRLEATTLSANTASNTILKKLGFQHEGTLRKYRYFETKFYDVEMFAKVSPMLAFAERLELEEVSEVA